MRLLHNILALVPGGKPQAAYIAHMAGLPRWLPERVNFTQVRALRRPSGAHPFGLVRPAIPGCYPAAPTDVRSGHQ